MAILPIRVTPRSAKPGIGGWRTGADGRKELEVRVAAAPTDGEANAAVIKLVAKALGLAKSAVRIAAGEASRRKRLEIAIEPDKLAELIDRIV